MKARNYQTSAFSLIELSVVLVIIGLLVGGIMAGQSMIRQAQSRAVVAGLAQYESAYTQFFRQYKGYPGDFIEAVDYWGAEASCPNGNNTTPHKTTCNGNGNYSIVAPENYRTWQHLANAGLISGSYTGVADSAGGATAGLNVPAGRLNGTAYYMETSGPYSSDPTYFDQRLATQLAFGKTVNGSWPTAPALTPEEQYSIDAKSDDGKPATGLLVSFKSPLNPGCNTADTNAADYNLQNKAVACTLRHLFDPKL